MKSLEVVVLALVVGFVAARLTWLLVRPVFDEPLFQRENFRGQVVATGAGFVVATGVLVVEAVRVVAAIAAGDGNRTSGGRVSVLILVLGFALLGLVDDLAGDGDRRGFRGHLAALGHGRLTTGGLKLIGGGATALIAVEIARPHSSFAEFLADAAVVALAANLGNLFDRAPGRTIKVATLAFVVLAVLTGANIGLAPVAVVIGAALGLLIDDLHEHVMLGDTGANLLGAVLGLGIVIVGTAVVRTAALGILAILNGASEWVSFSRVIDSIAPLRVLDRAGRRGS